ncbi:class I SAM-dependent RNA methyltransferase [Pontibaca salina]|uniref:Class I SAM-dependent RNA methyltransferase n=1 Tax=Pontibaca salina TaxID=2795731 RepID=A0A934LZT9_9RHOB|nr:class I SAM-dependent RNA methyltransferase [Pontibaca salina]MBI6629335.1 class I SAM-dependent RNA methyltransferase [Pontibaca salina]
MRETVTIERLGHKGAGVAPGPVFAPRCLPGETVSGERDGDRLTDIRIGTPAPERVTPPCRHYRACGGCQLQHASDGFVATWKQQVVHTALSAQGLETAFRPIVTSPPLSRRRATFAVRRTKKGTLCGFYGQASEVIADIPDCLLVLPEVLEGRAVAAALALAGASRKGALAVTVTASDNGLDISVSGGKPLDGPLRATLGGIAATQGLARLTWEGETVALAAPPVQQFGAARVVPPPGAFLQATREGETALLSAVREIVDDSARVVDLFAGCGTFSLPLATRAEVHAVEGATEMLKALDHGWRNTPGLKKVTTETRDLFRRPLRPDELAHYDAAVLDPPRAGAAAQIAELAQARLPVIAHVSCNPVSFARDVRHLVDAGYALDWVQVVDQFRWSAHVELVGKLRLIR